MDLRLKSDEPYMYFGKIFSTLTSQLEWVQVGNRENVCCYGRGDVRVSTCVDSKTCTVLLTKITCAPERMFNMISQNRVRKAGFIIITEDDINDSKHGITRLVHKKTEKT